HRGALDVAARIGFFLRNERQLDLGERLRVTLRGAREHLGLDAFHFLEREAERLADANGFAGELDLEAADGVVAQEIARGEAGLRVYSVAHAGLHELRPARAPEVGRRLRAVDAREPLGELLDPLRDAAVR